MNEQPPVHTALKIGAFVVLVACVAVVATVAYQKGWFSSSDVIETPAPEVRKSSVYIEQQNMIYSQAIGRSDVSILSTLPKPSTLQAETTEEVARLFDLSRLTSSFGAKEETVAYLEKILDSDSPNAEPFKSIAAFFLIQDAAADATLVVGAVEASRFMQGLRATAETVFPNDLEVAPEKMTPGQKARYLTSYLVALSEREDAFAASAKAASLIGSYYVYLLEKSETDKATLEKYKSLSHTLLRRATDRAVKVLPPYSAREMLSAYDAVAGLDNLAVIVDGIKAYKLESTFSEAKDLDASILLNIANSIAMGEAPGLDMYTAYLYAVHLARYSEDSQSNNDQIETLVKRLTGDSPFTGVNQYSWAAVELLGSKKSIDVTDVFRRENLAALARRSPTLREFLTVRDRWTDQDFLLKDAF